VGFFGTRGRGWRPRPKNAGPDGDGELRRLLIDSITDYAIFSLDSDGCVTSWNTGAQKLKGYSADEIIGRDFSCFYTEEDRREELPKNALTQARLHGHFEHEGWRVRKDGSKFWAWVVINAMKGPDGSLKGFAKVTRDLSERKQAEESRIRMAQLQEAARVRDEFLAYISHEMRTPLAALQLQIELLRERRALAAEEKIFERLKRSYQRLAELIDSVLLQSRIQAGRAVVQPAPVDLAALVADVVEEHRPAAERKALQIVCVNQVDPTTLSSDAEFLRLIVANLVGNAVKFTDSGKIQVRIEAGRAESRISVQDSGPGISAEDQKRIFEPFERVEPLRNKHTPGFGLGLATAKKLSEALGGRIELQSALGLGSTFTLVLPSESRTDFEQ
jgi:PAS domain S-box-containing protein